MISYILLLTLLGTGVIGLLMDKEWIVDWSLYGIWTLIFVTAALVLFQVV